MKPIDIVVHGAARATFPQKVDVDGDVVPAVVPCLEVEFVTKQDRHGNMTLRFAGGDLLEATELFTADAEFELVLRPKAKAETRKAA